MTRPRGRTGRIARPRLTRMDAAVDAMLPLGFPEALVKEHVKELLKEYGGDVGWPFIEESSYLVLIESIIEKMNDGEQLEEQGVQNGFLLEPVGNEEALQLSDKPCGDEEPGCSRASDTQEDVVPSDNMEPPTKAVAEVTPLPASSPPRDSTPPLLLPANRRTRLPCYGWIESDEDDEVEFISLTPAVSTAMGERTTLNVSTWRKKRRSRWDVKPGDP